MRLNVQILVLLFQDNSQEFVQELLDTELEGVVESAQYGNCLDAESQGMDFSNWSNGCVDVFGCGISFSSNTYYLLNQNNRPNEHAYYDLYEIVYASDYQDLDI